MEGLIRAWRRLPAAVRKSLVLLGGSAIVILGLILIPLPGPGWLVVFAGLALLATEFAVAEKLRERVLRKFKSALSKTRRKSAPKPPETTHKQPERKPKA